MILEIDREKYLFALSGELSLKGTMDLSEDNARIRIRIRRR